MVRSFGLAFIAATALTAIAFSQSPALQVPAPGRFEEFFRPFRTDHAAISPDGKYLAYSFRDGESLFLRIIAIDHPETVITQAPLIDDEDATPVLAIRRSEKTPGRITWLGWISPTRVVVETNRVLARSGRDNLWYGWRGSVVALNADGRQAKILASPDDTEEYAADAGPARARTGQPPRVGGADRPVDENAPAIPVADERLATAKTTGAGRLRSIRILGYDPDHPGSLILGATSPTAVATYRLDGQSGKLKRLSAELIEQGEDVLFDQQGRPRLTVSNTLRAGFPLHYEYRGPNGTLRGQSLDAATGVTGFTLSPENFFGERAIPLGFDDNPDLLYFATNAGRNTYGIYSVDLTTRTRGRLAMANPNFDLVAVPESGFPERRTLVRDHFRHQLAGVRFEGSTSTTVWVKPEWQELQAGFEKSFPGQAVTIVDWDEAGRRLVIMTESAADAGAFYVYDQEKNKLIELMRRAPWVDANRAPRALPFDCPTPDGGRISGVVTVPRQPRLRPVPMVVFCPDLPWQRVGSDFQAEVQALAEMGFVVVRLNGRGAWGFGVDQRRPLQTGYDLVQVEDIVTAVAHLAKVFPVNPDRVALLGRGHGGFIALRALQDHPDKFRGAIALDAPVSLSDWFAQQRWGEGAVQPALTLGAFGDETRLRANPLAGHPESVVKPILLLNYPGPVAGQRPPSFSAAKLFTDQVREHGTNVVFGELSSDFMDGLPRARAQVFDRIEEFLNLHIYDFNVKVHESQVVK
jgi:pimeloyl-ACP methyl ester carboxylesterase